LKLVIFWGWKETQRKRLHNTNRLKMIVKGVLQEGAFYKKGLEKPRASFRTWFAAQIKKTLNRNINRWRKSFRSTKRRNHLYISFLEKNYHSRFVITREGERTRKRDVEKRGQEGRKQNATRLNQLGFSHPSIEGGGSMVRGKRKTE